MNPEKHGINVELKNVSHLREFEREFEREREREFKITNLRRFVKFNLF